MLNLDQGNDEKKCKFHSKCHLFKSNLKWKRLKSNMHPNSEWWYLICFIEAKNVISTNFHKMSMTNTLNSSKEIIKGCKFNNIPSMFLPENCLRTVFEVENRNYIHLDTWRPASIPYFQVFLKQIFVIPKNWILCRKCLITRKKEQLLLLYLTSVLKSSQLIKILQVI